MIKIFFLLNNDLVSPPLMFELGQAGAGQQGVWTLKFSNHLNLPQHDKSSTNNKTIYHTAKADNSRVLVREMSRHFFEETGHPKFPDFF